MKLRELIDIGALRELCADFTEITGMATAILDFEGNILVASGWQDICTKYHRVNPASACRCSESDTLLAGGLREGEKYNVYNCKNGLTDVAVPIIVAGEHVGNLFTGQFFFEAPDQERFARQADEFGFDKGAYLDALSRVPIFTEDKVRTMMGFLVHLAQLVGSMGLSRELLYRESQRKQILFEQSPDGVLIIDPHTARLVEFNTAAHTQLGYTREEFGKLKIFDINAKENSEKTKGRIEEVLKSGRADYETLQRTKGGEVRHVHVTAQTVDVFGEKVYQCVWRDITEQRRAEQALRESEENYRQLFDAESDALFLIDNETGRILQANRAARDLYGYPRRPQEWTR